MKEIYYLFDWNNSAHTEFCIPVFHLFLFAIFLDLYEQTNKYNVRMIELRLIVIN